MIESEVLIYAFLGGLLPALLWLWFFLKEDSKRPEPKLLIVITFIAGMLSVFVALPLERQAEGLFAGTTLIIVWAAIEEILKYGAAAIVVLWRRACNEPIDGIVYMITVALGFAAFENTLFLLTPLGNGNIVDSILTGNLRFLGATLLHTLASALVGLAIAFSFYKGKFTKRLFVSTGLIAAIVLHVVFNLFIMNSNGEQTLLAFALVWVGIIVLFFVLERVKRLKGPIRRVFQRKK